jgi:hypothetical protein
MRFIAGAAAVFARESKICPSKVSKSRPGPPIDWWQGETQKQRCKNQAVSRRKQFLKANAEINNKLGKKVGFSNRGPVAQVDRAAVS